MTTFQINRFSILTSTSSNMPHLYSKHDMNILTKTGLIRYVTKHLENQNVPQKDARNHRLISTLSVRFNSHSPKIFNQPPKKQDLNHGRSFLLPYSPTKYEPSSLGRTYQEMHLSKLIFQLMKQSHCDSMLVSFKLAPTHQVFSFFFLFFFSFFFFFPQPHIIPHRPLLLQY